MNRILLIIFLILTPLVSFSRITFGGVVLSENELMYSWKNHSIIRRALLNANGKDWFMKHIIYRNPDSLSVFIKFHEDNHLGIGVKESYPGGPIPRVNREFFDGLKKAVDLMSQNNDTLLYLSFMKPSDPPLTILQLKPFHLIWVRADINYGEIDHSKNPKYNFAIEENYAFSYVKCLRNAFEAIFGELPEELNKYVYPMNYPDCRFDDTKFITVTSAEVAEKLYELVNRFDDYILGLPSPDPSQFAFFPYGYTPQSHDSDNGSQ